MPAVKNVGEPCAGEPHARFEVAAGGNQASRASTCRAAGRLSPTLLLELFPYVPLALDVRIGVAICSYDGTLGFGITGDGEHATDIPTLADGIEHELAQLLNRATPTPLLPHSRPRRRPTPAAGASKTN